MSCRIQKFVSILKSIWSGRVPRKHKTFRLWRRNSTLN